LKKTLGPVSLTALGIGAVIGSGIFTVIGTAIGGNPAKIVDWKGSPILDLIVGWLHHTSGAVAGRPGAGPALALSLVLVAIVCALTGLCYAELASMIPIAGSAYTYTYATLGELIAWVIGWDLILEYAFSNMSVSVGFAAHLVALMDWVGIPLSPKWLSPAYLPLGLQDLQGKYIYASGWHAGFNIPAFLIVLLLTVVLVRGIRESARTNNIMVLVKIAAILLFVYGFILWTMYLSFTNSKAFTNTTFVGLSTYQKLWTWTFDREPIIPRGAANDFDAKHTDAVTGYYFPERREFLYFYMGYPEHEQSRKISPFGSAQAVATQKLHETGGDQARHYSRTMPAGWTLGFGLGWGTTTLARERTSLGRHRKRVTHGA